VRAGVAGVEPARLVTLALEAQWPPAGAVHMVAVGKASAAMAAGALRVLGSRVVRGLVIGPVETPVDAPLNFIRGDHPLPGAGSERAGAAALAAATAADGAACLLVLVSGGASALMAAPAGGLSLSDKQEATACLLRSGVTISELNTVRKHLSAVKGGWLAAASPVPVVTLAISDVVGDDPAVIGSGPTVPDSSTFAQALSIVQRTGGRGCYPVAVIDRLQRGAAGAPEVAETPKPGDPRLARGRWTLIGGRREAMLAAAEAARRRGYEALVRDEAVTGEARVAAADWTPWIVQAARRSGRICLISSGETTVRVVGTGRGGRNQEFALALADFLSRADRPVALASVGTDGVDGPTDAAGAIVRTDTLRRAAERRLASPSAFLDTNDAYRYFEPLGDLIRTGPTGTNVGDLQICLIG